MLVLKFKVYYIGTGSYSLFIFSEEYTIVFKIHLDSFSFFTFMNILVLVSWGCAIGKENVQFLEICYPMYY